MRIKNLTKNKGPMGERNPLVKSHIPGDEIHRKAGTTGAYGVFELGFLRFFLLSCF